MHDVSLIMPCHNRAHDLARTLQGYERQAGDARFEIVAVDDGSTDATFDLLRAYRACAIAPDLRLLRSFPEDLSVWPLREEQPQFVEVVTLRPSGGPGSEAAQLVLGGLSQRLASKRRKIE